MLTLGRVADHVRQTLRGGDSSPSVIELVQLAGNRLTSVYPWQWSERVDTSLSTTAAQSYVDLAALGDFVGIRGVWYTNGQTYYLEPSSLGRVLDLRSSAAATGNRSPSLWALGGSTTAAGVFSQRLELFDTPNDAYDLTIRYTAGFQAPQTNADESKIAIPSAFDDLFISMVRAYARAYEEEDEGSLEARLTEILTGPLYLTCVSRDQGTRINTGYVTGGLLESDTYRFRYPASVADP